MSWNAEVTPGSDWLSITSGASGTGFGTINCSFPANTSTSSRTATVRVTATGATGSPVDVTVTQTLTPTPTPTLLWAETTGRASIWTMDADANNTSQMLYCPYEGWTAKSYYRNSDGTANMLWAENTGRASIWMMDTSGNKTSEMLYGPYEGWTAQDYD